MSTSTADVALLLTVQEILSAAEAPATSEELARTLTYSAFNGRQKLSSTSTPALDSPPAARAITLAGSTVTLDLTAMNLARSASETYDFTGKKLIAAIFKANSANVAAITIAPGASNAYAVFGTAKDIIIGPGRLEAFAFLSLGSDLPAVAAGAKNIDISGTSGDKLDVLLLFGS
jgi:hypothetical protein